MAEVNASIPLGVKPINATGRLSDLLQVKRQMVDIQRSQAETEGAQQTQKQRAALANFDVGKIIGSNGMIDLNKVPDSGLREAAGDQYPEQLAKYAGLYQQQLATQQGLVQLRDTQRNAIGQMVGAFRSDPDVANDTPQGRAKIQEAIAQAREAYAPEFSQVLDTFTKPLLNAPPGKLAQVAQNLQLQAASASEQASKQAPQYTQTGGELKQTNPLAQQGQSPESIPLTVAPGQQDTPTTGPDDNLYVQKRDAKGNIIGYEPAKGMPRFKVGEREATVAGATGETTDNLAQTVANRAAAREAPLQLDQIRKARELSYKADSGGKWLTSKRADVESALSSLIPGLSAAQSDATNLQVLEKKLESIAAASSKVLGQNANTDAARESISKQNASIGYTPQAIRSVLDYQEAVTLASQSKAEAQSRWFEQEGNSIKNQHNFEKEWSDAYDPRIFQIIAASDEDAAKLITKLSKEDKAALRKKRGLLKQMGAIE